MVLHERSLTQKLFIIKIVDYYSANYVTTLN